MTPSIICHHLDISTGYGDSSRVVPDRAAPLERETATLGETKRQGRDLDRPYEWRRLSSWEIFRSLFRLADFKLDRCDT